MKFYLPILLFLASPRIVPYSGGSVSGGGGATYTGAAPIDVTGTVISCTPASGVADGCMTAGTQTIGGAKVWNGVQYPNGAQSWNGGTISSMNTYGLAVGDLITMRLDGQGMSLENLRASTDPGAGLNVTSVHYRDAGSYFAVLTGGACYAQPLLTVQANGDLVYQAAPDNTCSQSANILEQGILTDGTTASGHVSMQSADGLYLTLRGRLTNRRDALEFDGGRPRFDGGYWIRTEPDGGAYYTYAGLHGALTIAQQDSAFGGWMLQIDNPNSDGGPEFGGPNKFHVDAWGAIGGDGMPRAYFPACPAWLQQTYLGQFYYGVAQSGMLWASDEERWYLCTSSGWAPLGQVPSYLPPVLVNAALTVSTLGGFVLPSGYTPTVSALSFYVGASGTGGSTNATIRLSDGTHQCDFAFACNTSTGAKRVAGAGAGCSAFTAGSSYTLSVTSIGDCGTGPTLTGNATVEALWR